MSYLDRDGVSIYYEQQGAGPSVLLSHGYSASARMWQGQVEALADNYHVIAWDMRGHDRSDSPDDPALYSHEATIHDMAAVLDACGVGRAIVAGLSLGGFMSLAFYLAHPTRTEALMLFDTGPGYKKDEEFEADREGMRLAVLDGYSPYGAVTLFERFSKLHSEYVIHAQSPEEELSQLAIQSLQGYFRSHPQPSERLAQANNLIAQEGWQDRKAQRPFRVEYEVENGRFVK